MGTILNLRGTGGAGKTELARRIIAFYDPEGVAARPQPGKIGVRLPHPRGGRPLAVLGQYADRNGGCDRIRASEGGLDAAIHWAAERAAAGDDVLLEGLRLSFDVERTRQLARSGCLHVLRLSTPPECCARNLVARRRLRKAARHELAAALAADASRLDDACLELAPDATIETLPFDAAFDRARILLGV